MEINNIFKELNNPNSDLERFDAISDVAVGQILAAVFPSDNDHEEFYRAKVIFIEKEKESKKSIFEVIE